MSELKLTSNEVPQKFVEWLLAMGCQPEIVPPVEKAAEICRGQYYMVWRSLMEKIEAKDIIKTKRFQVFCNDVKKCQKKNIFENDSSTVVPKELLLWRKHTQLKEKVAAAETRLAKEKESLHQLTVHTTSKLSQCNLLRKHAEDAQRRAHLLQRVTEQRRDEKAKLIETAGIVKSLCSNSDETDIESKLSKCIAVVTRQATAVGSKPGAGLSSTSNPAVSSSSTFVSTAGDDNDDEVIECVAQCRGDAIFRHLYERRAALNASIPHDQNKTTTTQNNKVRSVVCHTAALQSFISLEVMKSRLYVRRTRNSLAASFINLNERLSREECELVITLCERACIEARMQSLRNTRQDIENRRGVFATGAQQEGKPANTSNLQSIDASIESKRDELKRLMTSVATLERKTQSVKDRLLSLFNGFHDNGSVYGDRFEERTSPYRASVATNRQFYEEKREKIKNKVELSMNLDTSEECSYNDTTDGSRNFMNELKLYLNRFSLEKNRKLVLDNGEKIWIFETVNSLLEDMFSKWESHGIVTTMLCPTLTFKKNLEGILQDVISKEDLETVVQALNDVKISGREIDITSTTEEERNILDKIKKRLHENIQSLQKTDQILDDCMGNLQFWSNNSIKKYISDCRKVNNEVSYSSYEQAYLHSVMS